MEDFPQQVWDNYKSVFLPWLEDSAIPWLLEFFWGWLPKPIFLIIQSHPVLISTLSFFYLTFLNFRFQKFKKENADFSEKTFLLRQAVWVTGLFLVFYFAYGKSHGDDLYWQEVGGKNTVEAYREYIENYPNSANIEKAEANLWWKDKKAYVKIFGKYLEDHPNGRLVGNIIDRFFESDKDLFFDSGLKYIHKYPTGRIAPYIRTKFLTLEPNLFIKETLSYLKAYPNDSHSLEARLQLRDLDKNLFLDSAFEYLVQYPYESQSKTLRKRLLEDSPSKYIDASLIYLKNSPNGDAAQEIRDELFKLDKKIYLKEAVSFLTAFPNEQHAETERKRLKGLDEKIYTELGLSYLRKYPDGRFSQEIVENLKTVKDYTPLLGLFKDPDPKLRLNAVRALGGHRQPQVLEALIEGLKDHDLLVKNEIISLLGDFKVTKAVDPLVEIAKTTSELRKACFNALGRIGTPAVPPLLTLLKSQVMELKIGAIESLGKTNSNAVVQPLILLLEDGDRRVVSTTIISLGELQTPKAIDPLIKILKTNPTFRKEVKNALSSLGYTTEDALLMILESVSNKFSLKVDVIEILGNIKSKKGIPHLIRILGDFNNEHPKVRAAAATALGKIQDPKVLDPLILALANFTFEIQTAREILGYTASNHSNGFVIKEFRNADREVKVKAREALIDIGGQKTIGRLKYYLTTWNLNNQVLGVLNGLNWTPNSDIEFVHAWLAGRQGQILRKNWETTKTVLLKDVESTRYEPIENALYGFIGIGKSSIIPTLIQKLEEKGNKVMAEAYLNCGHPELDGAARSWAARRGYQIFSGQGHSPIGWGTL